MKKQEIYLNAPVVFDSLEEGLSIFLSQKEQLADNIESFGAASHVYDPYNLYYLTYSLALKKILFLAENWEELAQKPLLEAISQKLTEYFQHIKDTENVNFGGKDFLHALIEKIHQAV